MPSYFIPVSFSLRVAKTFGLRLLLKKINKLHHYIALDFSAVHCMALHFVILCYALVPHTIVYYTILYYSITILSPTHEIDICSRPGHVSPVHEVETKSKITLIFFSICTFKEMVD